MTVSHEISLDNLSVCIGMPSSRDIHPLVVKSMFATKDLCSKHGISCSLAMVAGNAVVQWARDEVVDLLLQSDANRFFFVDSDMVWEPEDFMSLLALSQRRDIVCAAYTAKRDQPTFFIRYDESKPLRADEYGLIEILGVGLGFTVMRREVVQEVSDSSVAIHDEITSRDIPSIFHIGTHNGSRRGEDMSFFERITDLGHKIYLDPSISLGHLGLKVYKGCPLDAFQELK